MNYGARSIWYRLVCVRPQLTELAIYLAYSECPGHNRRVKYGGWFRPQYRGQLEITDRLLIASSLGPHPKTQAKGGVALELASKDNCWGKSSTGPLFSVCLSASVCLSVPD